jgi:hypothetical protein
MTGDVSDLHVTWRDPATVAPSSLANSPGDLDTSPEMTPSFGGAARLPGFGDFADTFFRCDTRFAGSSNLT